MCRVTALISDAPGAWGHRGREQEATWPKTPRDVGSEGTLGPRGVLGSKETLNLRGLSVSRRDSGGAQSRRTVDLRGLRHRCRGDAQSRRMVDIRGRTGGRGRRILVTSGPEWTPNLGAPWSRGRGIGIVACRRGMSMEVLGSLRSSPSPGLGARLGPGPRAPTWPPAAAGSRATWQPSVR